MKTGVKGQVLGQGNENGITAEIDQDHGNDINLE